MMRKNGWNALDEAAEKAGGYLAKPKRPLVIEYDYLSMTNYCLKNGISKTLYSPYIQIALQLIDVVKRFEQRRFGGNKTWE
ncbi:MAG: hypothetical protein FWH55_13105 [Oscillospiraceae bacterium]|nr:hypothetical protein [Oscillospiraceae bacterium]